LQLLQLSTWPNEFKDPRAGEGVSPAPQKMSQKDTFAEKGNKQSDDNLNGKSSKSRIIAAVVAVSVLVCVSLLVVGYYFRPSRTNMPKAVPQTDDDFKFIENEEVPPFASQAFRIAYHGYKMIPVSSNPVILIRTATFSTFIDQNMTVNLLAFMRQTTELKYISKYNNRMAERINSAVISVLINFGFDIQEMDSEDMAERRESSFKSLNENQFLQQNFDSAADRSRNGMKWFSEMFPNFIPIAMAVDIDESKRFSEKSFLVYLRQGDNTWTMYDDVENTKTAGISEAQISQLAPHYILYRNRSFG
jgi:hypothetical protein